MRESSSARILLGAAVVFGVFLVRNAGLNQPAPPFSLPETYGGQVDLASYRGRPVLLVFWSASCSICRRELPLVNRLAPELRDKGMGVVAIHLGGEDEARDYVSSNHIDLTCLVDSDGTVGRAYGVSGIPKLVLIGNDGKVKRTREGLASDGMLRDWANAVTGN